MNNSQINVSCVLEALRLVIDPEIGCNIVDLGLVYHVEIYERKVTVLMTLTSPGCPMQESLVWGVESVLGRVDGVEAIDVQVVWEPPWNPAMMTAQGRSALSGGRY